MSAQPAVVHGSTETLWFLGTLARMKLDGAQTGGRFGLWEGVLPRGAAPPLHSHPQDETLYLLEGELTAWLADGAAPGDWASRGAAMRRRGSGVRAGRDAAHLPRRVGHGAGARALNARRHRGHGPRPRRARALAVAAASARGPAGRRPSASRPSSARRGWSATAAPAAGLAHGQPAQGQDGARGGSSSSARQSSRGGEKTSITIAPSAPARPACGTPGRDRPGLARAERARLAADRHLDRAGDDDPELLVDVMVLGERRVGLELDHAERDGRPVERAAGDAVPDALARERRDPAEGRH